MTSLSGVNGIRPERHFPLSAAVDQVARTQMARAQHVTHLLLDDLLVLVAGNDDSVAVAAFQKNDPGRTTGRLHLRIDQ
jgi:hypothetical protein